MDLLTQGLLGACSAVAVSRGQSLRKAALIGLVAGLAADLDILISSADDPLLNLEFHRHFSHSILFVPFAALLLAGLSWPFARRFFSFKKLYLLTFFGYLPSGFLDACTSYGTLLFWPISEQRVSFNIISIIDPLFTLVLLVGVVAATLRLQTRIAVAALCLAVCYLGFGLLQKNAIQQHAQQLAQARGHSADRLLVKPTLGNLLLWRSVYRYQDRYYVDAIRSNPFNGRLDRFVGGSIPAFDAASNPLQLAPDSLLFKDIQRFAYFSDRYLAQHPDNPNLIIDLRYANLPHQLEPLWGIRIDPSRPNRHAEFEHFRDRSKQARDAFLGMLFP